METFETSPTTAKLDAAIAKAQGEIEAAAKDKTNPAFNSRYADLAAVWEACRAPLAKHGVSITQWPVHSEDNRIHLITRVAHDGEWMRAVSSIPAGKQDAHGYGSAITYAKRYALCAAIGVVADEDDDGNAATDSARENGGSAKPAEAFSLDSPAAGKKHKGKTWREVLEIDADYVEWALENMTSLSTEAKLALRDALTAAGAAPASDSAALLRERYVALLEDARVLGAINETQHADSVAWLDENHAADVLEKAIDVVQKRIERRRQGAGRVAPQGELAGVAG